MNRYSKIKIKCSDNTSRSSDIPDLSPCPQPPRTSVSSHPRTNQTQNPQEKSDSKHSEQEEDGEVDGGKRSYGEVLSRARSVSSTTTPRAIHCAVKRAFSMRRSSSVSEGYSRIHDQSVTLASPIEDEDDGGCVDFARSDKKKGKRGKILKVCKLLFGL